MKINRSIHRPACFAVALIAAGAVRADDLIKGYTLSPVTEHLGALDGSAGIAIDATRFLSVSDEENVFRLYSTEDGKKTVPLTVGPKDFNVWVKAPPKNHPGKFHECDLEGAARIGNRIYWIGSHGRNGEGEVRPERCVLFATDVGESDDKGTQLTLVGDGPYRKLREDLQGVSDPGVAALLVKATGGPDKDGTLAPKNPGALNIESLCADGEKLLIGFRNPIAEAGALVVPLLNPAAVVEHGERAKLGPPVKLQLGGRGIRDMARWRGGFLVIAGEVGDRFDEGAHPSDLYFWKREAGTLAQIDVQLTDLNPEAAVLFPGTDGEGSDRLLILSDDGKRTIGGKLNEDRPRPEQSFRSVWLQPPP